MDEMNMQWYKQVLYSPEGLQCTWDHWYVFLLPHASDIHPKNMTSWKQLFIHIHAHNDNNNTHNKHHHHYNVIPAQILPFRVLGVAFLASDKCYCYCPLEEQLQRQLVIMVDMLGNLWLHPDFQKSPNNQWMPHLMSFIICISHPKCDTLQGP